MRAAFQILELPVGILSPPLFASLHMLLSWVGLPACHLRVERPQAAHLSTASPAHRPPLELGKDKIDRRDKKAII